MRHALGLITGVLLGMPAFAASADRYELSFFSVAPPANWHVESDKDKRLLASGSGSEAPPLLIVESCRSGQPGCPGQCDLPALERSGMVEGLHMTFKPVAREDGYREYAASDVQATGGDKAFTSVRLLCGPSGFIYAAFMDGASMQAADGALDAVVGSIAWKK